MQPFSLPLPPPLPPPPARPDLPPPHAHAHVHSTHPGTPSSPTRARPPPSEHIQVVRELWLLRERGAVSALEPDFLMRLAFLLGGGVRVREARRDEHWVRARDTDTDCVDNSHSHSVANEPVSPTRIREHHAATRLGVDAARAQQRVTRLSPAFRARLEGLSTSEDTTNGNVGRTIQRSSSWDELDEQRAVTGALESAFRHELEGVLVRRGTRNDARLYAQPMVTTTRREHNAIVSDPEDEHDFHPGGTTSVGVGSGVRRELASLKEEIAALKQMMHASFDIQLDTQRAIRQEVAAAMHAHTSGNTKRVNAPLPPAPKQVTAAGSSRQVRSLVAGQCAICLDAPIDSLLYACGHMCTCAPCGRQLLASGDKCPMCRAPVRDVVVAFLAS